MLAKRYADKPIIWILGGDRNIDYEDAYIQWVAMAEGIKGVVGSKQLLSYHPRGTANSYWWFHNHPLFDFNTYQSGHEKWNKIYEYTAKHSLLHPVKPFVDAEPAYEDIATRFWEYMDFSKNNHERVPEGVLHPDGTIKDRAHFEEGFIDDYDVRIHAYWNFLGGAVGYTYGNNAIWQMFKKNQPIAIPPLTDWREAMDRPGAAVMQHVVKLLQSRPFEKLRPNPALVYGKNRFDSDYVAAASAEDYSYAYVYIAKGQVVVLDLTQFRASDVQSSWYDPRVGSFLKSNLITRESLHKDPRVSFKPPSNGHHNDWVLVLDSSH